MSFRGLTDAALHHRRQHIIGLLAALNEETQRRIFRTKETLG